MEELQEYMELVKTSIEIINKKVDILFNELLKIQKEIKTMKKTESIDNHTL